eukprot:TRINITY_DN41149_c0_g1_i1.p1 TRINITY_DN41149_c0_g1~~TRINITY_DN41149_c0_g1_i1.p1  ORF type:complete len:702 (+),score=147.15 TRINITY_DN41149_c0_g1_i1:57-2162(+)
MESLQTWWQNLLQACTGETARIDSPADSREPPVDLCARPVSKEPEILQELREEDVIVNLDKTAAPKLEPDPKLEPVSEVTISKEKCVNCGNVLMSDSIVCRKCGHRVGAPLDEQRREIAVASVATEERACGTSPQGQLSVPLDRSTEELDVEHRRSQKEYNQLLENKRKSHVSSSFKLADVGPANRYNTDGTFPEFVKGKHVPTLALINDKSGAGAGRDILQVAMRSSTQYKERFFSIIDVVKDQARGGLLDVFRYELNEAKQEAKDMGMRPRVISGGGDGTGSFTIFMIFLALKADPDRVDIDGDLFKDTGNGFIWTDEEMAESFPALAQMPLGSANDFGNILGWGQKYPGYVSDCYCCGAREVAMSRLYRWIEAVIDPKSRVVNFDIWGFMPPKGKETVDFRLAELTGKRGRCPNKVVDGKRQIALAKAGKPVPLFVCLYFSAGIGAYMTSRFQINRRRTPLRNRIEYVKQLLGIVAESTPPQLDLRLTGVSVDCDSQPYFPPRRRPNVNLGRKYREVGFYNINWQAHGLHGADRASLGARLCSRRLPVMFNDGKLDMFRWKFASFFKNPGVTMQTDKKEDMLLTYESTTKGKGIFFQWDGEARFAFSPTNEPFHIFIRKVLNLPVVIGPFIDESLTGNLDNGKEVKFSFSGSTPEEMDQVRRRVLKSVSGKLDSELNATPEEIEAAGLRLAVLTSHTA